MATVAAVVVLVLLATAAWGVLDRLAAGADPDDDVGPGPLGMVAGVRPAGAEAKEGGGPVVLRVVAPSYGGADLAACRIDERGPAPGTYRLELVRDADDYDRALGGVAGDWFITTGRDAQGRAVVSAHTPTERVECSVAAGAERLLPARTLTWSLSGGGPDTVLVP